MHRLRTFGYSVASSASSWKCVTHSVYAVVATASRSHTAHAMPTPSSLDVLHTGVRREMGGR